MSKDTYGAKSEYVSNGEDSANEGITVQADSPEQALEEFQELTGGTVPINAVIDEDTGEETRFD